MGEMSGLMTPPRVVARQQPLSPILSSAAFERWFAWLEASGSTTLNTGKE